MSSLLSLGGGRLVAAGRDDEPRLYLWAGEGTNPLTNLALPRPPAALTLTPSGSLACLAEADGTVRVISLEGLWPSVVVTVNKPGTKAKPVGPPKEMPKEKLPPFTGHKGTVNTVAYSSNGKMVLTGGADGTARLWDAATGEELVRINHDKVVYCARFRAKDRTVLTLGTGPDAKVWDVEDGTMLHRLPVLSRQQPVIAGDASSEGDDVIAAVGKFTFHYRPGPRDVAIPRQRQAHPAEVTCVAYAPGATHYAVGLSTGVVQIYAVGQARELASFPAHKGPVTSLAWSPKDLRLVSGGQDRTMVLRSLKNLKFYRKFTGHDGAETGITLSPDGKHFASSSKNRTVRLWEPGGRQSRAFKHENPIQGVAFSPNGARLAACGEGGLVFHDLAGGKKAVKGP